MDSKNSQLEEKYKNSEDFGTLLNQFHNENPHAWEEMRAEKRGPRSPRRNIDTIDLLLRHDLEVVGKLISIILQRREERYAHEMAELDRGDGIIPSEVTLATAELIEDQRFLSQFEIEFREINNSESSNQIVDIQVQSRKELEKIFAKDTLLNRRVKEDGALVSETLEDTAAKKDLKQLFTHIAEEIKVYKQAKGEVIAGLPDGLSASKTSIDIDQIEYLWAQINRAGIHLDNTLMHSEIQERITGTHWKPGTGLIVLETKRYVDFLICQSGSGEVLSVLVSGKKKAIDDCIQELKKISDRDDQEVQKIIEYLKKFSFILNY